LIEYGIVEGPIAALPKVCHSVVSGLYCVTYANVEAFIKGQDMFVINELEELKHYTPKWYITICSSVNG
jgi:hypothetical protein